MGILGPNGAGKTTLFNLIAGTVRPDAGRVVFKGVEVSRPGVAARCHAGISRSFQIPHPFDSMSVFENVLVGPAFGRKAGDPEARAAEVLVLTGLRPKANALAGALTLLERKRLELARALATDPELLLDEIAGGLTDRGCRALLAAVRDVRGSGVTAVWIEHVVHALLSGAERLVVVDFGRVIADGLPADVPASDQMRSVCMGAEGQVIKDIYAQLPLITGQGKSAILVGQDVTRAPAAAGQFLCLQEGRVSLQGQPGEHSRDAISAAYFRA